jgi:hypothetical protein
MADSDSRQSRLVYWSGVPSREGWWGAVMAEDKHEPRFRWLYCMLVDGARTTVNACSCCCNVGNISRVLKRVKDQCHLSLSSDPLRSCRHYEGPLIGFVAVQCTNWCVGSSRLWNFLLNCSSFLFSFSCFPSDMLPQVQVQPLLVVSCRETLSYRTGTLRTHCKMSSAKTLGAIQKSMFRLRGKPQKFPVMFSCNLDHNFFRNFQTWMIGLHTDDWAETL